MHPCQTEPHHRRNAAETSATEQYLADTYLEMVPSWLGDELGAYEGSEALCHSAHELCAGRDGIGVKSIV